MRITSDQTIAGFPAKALRASLKRRQGFSFRPEEMAIELGQPPEDGDEIMRRLEEVGLVCRNESSHDRQAWVATTEGNALANASMRKPTPRKSADRILSDFLQRVQQINDDDYYLYGVEEVVVFGSYVDESRDTVNDIDLAIRLFPKESDNEKAYRLRQERADQAQDKGRSFSNIVEAFMWAETEVLRFLKSRSPVLSFNHPEDSILQQTETKVIYTRS